MPDLPATNAQTSRQARTFPPERPAQDPLYSKKPETSVRREQRQTSNSPAQVVTRVPRPQPLLQIDQQEKDEPALSSGLRKPQPLRPIEKQTAPPPVETQSKFETAFHPSQPFAEAEKADIPPHRIGDEIVDPVRLPEYSNEARVYHARYDELSEAHDRGDYNMCKQSCLDLLLEPRIPRYTRIQTPQMLSTTLSPDQAETCLHEAQGILDNMDKTKFQVQLLIDDNEKMLADLATSDAKKDLVGEDLSQALTEAEHDGMASKGEQSWPGARYSSTEHDLIRQQLEDELESLRHKAKGTSNSAADDNRPAFGNIGSDTTPLKRSIFDSL
ncbi:hypothetical protein PRZ48_009281 [Zasmidium cellare]|uniref:Uncharacterized protein n=1 Tax=Zasmidium cellare TaxID=395010 RepID=A0ABR0EBY5_ZASCE|nr:hypothetical protein PRZ48_009281 [Zasmidium cellare]